MQGDAARRQLYSFRPVGLKMPKLGDQNTPYTRCHARAMFVVFIMVMSSRREVVWLELARPSGNNRPRWDLADLQAKGITRIRDRLLLYNLNATLRVDIVGAT